MIPAWKLPPIIATIAVAIVGGFYLGGPGLGMAVGALAAASIVVAAVRNPPRGPICPARLSDLRPHLLIVVGAPLEDSKAMAQIAELGHVGDSEWAEAEFLVLAPARWRFLDRWSSDRGLAHGQAHDSLVVTLASLARVGVAAAAKIGDEDLVQAVEDELRVFPATEVILITPARGQDSAEDSASSELASRLQCDYRRIVSTSGGTSTSRRRSGDLGRSGQGLVD